MTSKVSQLSRLSDDKLMDLLFNQLDLKLKSSRIQPFIERLYSELSDKGIRFKPHCWISTEWFAQDGVPGIAIPFFVLHPRLARLERKLTFEVEGWSERDCMKLLRHEAGHAIDNAFHLRKLRRRQKLFGLSSTPYPESYTPQAYSKKFVVHLNSWYAQSHPDEDWAETFAVWLNPASNWKKRYAKWPALQKLKLVDELMKEIKGKTPKVGRKECPGDITKIRKKIKTYYQEKIDMYGIDQPFYMDPYLLRLFSADTKYKKNKPAARFIREQSTDLRRIVAQWTGQYRYTINLILKELIESCENKKLRLTTSEEEAKMHLIGLLSTQSLNYITSGNHSIPM